jgi:hypothetical protein
MRQIAEENVDGQLAGAEQRARRRRLSASREVGVVLAAGGDAGRELRDAGREQRDAGAGAAAVRTARSAVGGQGRISAGGGGARARRRRMQRRAPTLLRMQGETRRDARAGEWGGGAASLPELR